MKCWAPALSATALPMDGQRCSELCIRIKHVNNTL